MTDEMKGHIMPSEFVSAGRMLLIQSLGEVRCPAFAPARSFSASSAKGRPALAALMGVKSLVFRALKQWSIMAANPVRMTRAVGDQPRRLRQKDLIDLPRVRTKRADFDTGTTQLEVVPRKQRKVSEKRGRHPPSASAGRMAE